MRAYRDVVSIGAVRNTVLSARSGARCRWVARNDEALFMKFRSRKLILE